VVSDALTAIAALGVGVSLDDFGSGESAAADLACFPIDCVKLDRALVDRIGQDPASEERIRGLRAIAARLKMRVVAEGVEHPQQQAFLAALGCDLMQGYRFVRPMPGDMLPDWLASNGASSLLKTKSSASSGASASA
jgi:EAL domain-containing protein (putative c-di-GMP-specific phosphodiesterase class I)